jgi:excisionase family DNA binding protein
VLVSFLGPDHPAREGIVMTARTYESLASAAARMGVSVKTVRRRIADGVLPVYRCGRILRLDPNDVDGMFRRSPRPTVAASHSMGRTARRVS